MPDYSDHPITKLTMKYLDANARSNDFVGVSRSLFIALECPAIGVGAGFGEGNLTWVDTNPDNRGAVAQNLLALFSVVAGEVAEKRQANVLGQLLCGMERSQCWQRLIASEGGAYLLANGLLGYVEYYVEDFAIDVATEPSICRILNAWLKPDVQWVRPPSIGSLCEHMFGSTWAMLALPDDQWSPLGGWYEDKDVASTRMLQERPPFQPGLCRATEVQSGVELPGDVGMGT
jgi:hypothetical protein